MIRQSSMPITPRYLKLFSSNHIVKVFMSDLIQVKSKGKHNRLNNICRTIWKNRINALCTIQWLGTRTTAKNGQTFLTIQV